MNKKKKSTNISPYPDEAIERLARAFYPAILACWNSEEGQRSLVGARPLHLACARPFGRLKAPLGLSLLRCAAQTQACLWQAEQAHHTTSKEKQSVPDGERPAVHIVIVCGLWQGASYSGAHPVFYFVLNLLTHGSQPYFSNILPARRLESNLHNAILFGIRRAFPDLAFDGFFALIVAGIAGVDYSGHRRASLCSVWGWM